MSDKQARRVEAEKGLYEVTGSIVALLQRPEDDLVSFFDDFLACFLEPKRAPKINLTRAMRDSLKENRAIFQRRMLSTLEKAIKRYALKPSLLRNYKHVNFYLKHMSNYVIFYLIWLRLHNAQISKEQTEEAFQSIVLGTLGYRLIDLHFDERGVAPHEALLGLALIDEHEHMLKNVFGADNVHCDVFRRSKERFFSIEIREKEARGRRSTYSFNNPIECSYKAAPIFPFFALSLAQTGKTALIPKYDDIFSLIAAVIQIHDDVEDLADDLSHGLLTLPTADMEKKLRKLSPSEGAAAILNDKNRMHRLHSVCYEMLTRASALCAEVDDPMFALVAEYKSVFHRSNLERKSVK